MLGLYIYTLVDILLLKMDYINAGIPQNNSVTTDDSIAEVLALKNSLQNSNAPIELKNDAISSIERLERIARKGVYSAEFENVNKYIQWITRIPWGVVSQDNFDLQHAKELMDSTHYGMDPVKNVIMDYLASMQLEARQSTVGTNNPPYQSLGSLGERASVDTTTVRPKIVKAPVFLFVGLQGVGKTSIAKSIAEAMGRKFARISLGAIGDVRTLRGTPRYALDPEPGQVIKALVRSGTMNPVILLDEIEKASGNAGLLNDVMAALLEILDPEQNSSFIDHYVDYPVDLSKAFFICTANNLGGLSAALLDRVEIIRFTSYSDDEKAVIAKRYILPRVLSGLNLSEEFVRIDENVWPMIIRPVGFDAGIRQLERNIAGIVRAAARKIIEGTPVPIVVTSENISQYLPPDQGPLS
ncbi:MAG: Lon protease 2 [candidate division WS6 bacterium GW2011_GWC2_36_7]|uniref:Lon protease 2 n=3 Tax=Candidatus Dojkabacteria TaxID=74243 RepID=A0A0G0FJE5_9BACT|nr:MAG: Lon protease 2 [candidate division WS6 bacterium GW2011_WS6_36_26]KKQ11391.1 MAG: Lon protease 2 [candidate division WS6 bacterium GW2011_GWC2_36_7]KKQ17952.1 MAG: Lon protease 2 [candidate division WS6 bacterium GW2011_GWF1_36_8]